MRLREYLDKMYPNTPKVQVNANIIKGQDHKGREITLDLAPVFWRPDPYKPAQILLGSSVFHCGRIFYHEAKGWDFDSKQ